MDAYGLRPALDAHVRRLAAGGYTVLAPNLFYRSLRAPIPDIERLMQGGDRSALWEQLRPLMGTITPEGADADAGAFLAYLRGLDLVASGPIGTVGYCMGGRYSLRMSGTFPADVGAAASFHGGNLATDDESSPHRRAVLAHGELYVGHADNDGSMPPDQMGRLTQALAEAHVRHTAELYVGAAHGWTQTDAAVYSPTASERHWERLFELFGRVLRPGVG